MTLRANDHQTRRIGGTPPPICASRNPASISWGDKVEMFSLRVVDARIKVNGKQSAVRTSRISARDQRGGGV